MNNLLKASAVTCLCFAPFLCGQEGKAAGIIAIRAARLIDGKSDTIIDNALVVVDGKKMQRSSIWVTKRCCRA